MRVSLTALLEQLVSFPSLSGEERSVAEFMADLLTSSGFHVLEQPVDERRFNLLATTGKNPEVVLCTHLDVVAPWIPFSRQGSTLFGRGVCDAKGALAAMFQSGQRLRDEGEERFGFLFVVGEEHDSDGAKRASSLGVESRFVVIGEPTDNCLVKAQKGTLVFRLDCSGIAGHSAVPESGRSAVHELARRIQRWLDTEWGSDPELGETTLNFGVVNGGTGANVIAGSARAEGIFRIATSVSDVLSRAQQQTGDACLLEVRSSSSPLRLHTVPGFREAIVSFGSDAPYLGSLGKVLMMGPGSIRFAHRDDEQVTVGELEAAVDSYARLVKTLLADRSGRSG